MSNKDKTSQLEQWQGHLGDEYIDRNLLEGWKVDLGKEAFRRMLSTVEVNSILEVGCNIGLNLVYLYELFKGKIELYALEPNQRAFSILNSDHRKNLKELWNCSAFNMPLADSSVDLVFTSGVLIHISPKDLGRATDEIVRVARRYILCSEYFSHEPTEQKYRGENGLLFKRDFGSFYLDRYSKLKYIDYGFLWMQEFKIFDNMNWWLFEKA